MPRSASPVSQATHSTPYSTRLAQRHNGAALALLISTTSQPSRHSLPPAATTTTVRLDYLSCQQSSIHPPTPPLLTIFTILQPSSVNSQFTPTHSHLRPPPRRHCPQHSPSLPILHRSHHHLARRTLTDAPRFRRTPSGRLPAVTLTIRSSTVTRPHRESPLPPLTHPSIALIPIPIHSCIPN